jgi:hypothetical protein
MHPGPDGNGPDQPAASSAPAPSAQNS